MLFRTLVAPFARGLAPRGWVVPLLTLGFAGAKAFMDNRRQSQYRREYDQAREDRANLFAAVGPRVAGLESLPPDILRAAGRGLPPAPPPQTTNLFQQAMQIAGAYTANRQADAGGDERAPVEASPSVSPTTDVMPPPQAAQMGAMTEGANVDPATQEEQSQVAAGAGQQGPPAQMGAMTQQPAGEDMAAQQTAQNREMFNPLMAYALEG